MLRLLLILCLVTLASCKNENVIISNLIGIWETSLCEKQLDFDGVWIKGNYEFTSEGKIKYERKAYEDSNCVTLIDPSRYIYGFPYTAVYQDLGEETLMEGIKGNRVTIEITGPTNNRTDAEGYYTINNGSLCFSSVFIFDAGGYSIDEAGEAGINLGADLLIPRNSTINSMSKG